MKKTKEKVARFAMVPLIAASDARLGKLDYRVLIALICHAGKSGVCHPKRETIAELTLIPTTRISTITSKLQRIGWLKKTGNGGRNSPADYIITIPETVTETVTVTDSVTVTETVIKTVTKSVTGNQKTSEKSLKDFTSEKNLRPLKEPKFIPKDLELAEWIYGLILGLNPEAKKPNLEAWADTIRLMRERDNRTHRGIAELFKWANDHHFWKTNILSPEKLRKQYDSLKTKKDHEHARPERAETQSDINKRITDRIFGRTAEPDYDSDFRRSVVGDSEIGSGDIHAFSHLGKLILDS